MVELNETQYKLREAETNIDGLNKELFLLRQRPLVIEKALSPIKYSITKQISRMEKEMFAYSQERYEQRFIDEMFYELFKDPNFRKLCVIDKCTNPHTLEDMYRLTLTVFKG